MLIEYEHVNGFAVSLTSRKNNTSHMYLIFIEGLSRLLILLFIPSVVFKFHGIECGSIATSRAQTQIPVCTEKLMKIKLWS